MNIRSITLPLFIFLFILNLFSQAPFVAHAQPSLSQETPSQEAMPSENNIKTTQIISHFIPPRYPQLKGNLDYVNPQAPKGGTLILKSSSTFDTLNPFVLKGTAAPGAALLYESLYATIEGDIYNHYPNIAERARVPDDNTWVEFFLNPKAKFSDGSSITPEDVVFSFNTLKKDGLYYRNYYKDVLKAEKTGDHSVKFTFQDGNNKELPGITSQLFILSKKYWQDKKFDTVTQAPPVSSGPYTVERFEVGKTVVYKRNPNYWGRDEFIHRGRHNFERVKFDVYRDNNIAFEAFKSGDYDFQIEVNADNWVNGYDFDDIKNGKVIKKVVPNNQPTNMQAYVFNVRSPKFSNRRIREAIALMFDFEWSNKNIFHSTRQRTRSNFEKSPFEATGIPLGRELELLTAIKDSLPVQLFTQPFQLPKTDGSVRIRDQVRKALALLKETDWEINSSGILSHKKTGQPFQFEILLSQANVHLQQITAPFINNLKRIGIKASMRIADSAEYERRTENFQFDMIVHAYNLILSPGNEQLDMWGSKAANMPGSMNLPGVRNPAIDMLAEKVINAANFKELVASSRALDRILMWEHYLIPQYHLPNLYIAYKSTLKHPKTPPRYGLGYIDTWWFDPATVPAKKTS